MASLENIMYGRELLPVDIIGVLCLVRASAGEPRTRPGLETKTVLVVINEKEKTWRNKGDYTSQQEVLHIPHHNRKSFTHHI